MEAKMLEAFLEYENLKLEEKRIKARIDELNPILTDALPPEEEFLTENGGKFVVETRFYGWKYSPEVEEMAKTLKQRQDEEKAKGIARSAPTSVLVYRSGTNAQ